MNEENLNSVDKNTDWQAPQPPIYNEPAAELPQMSAMATLGNVFFDPGAVFEDLRKKPFPRLIFPLILCAVLLTTYTVSLNTKIGSEGIVREQMKSPWMAQVPEETKQKMLDEAKKTSPVKAILTSSISGVSMVIVLAIIGLVYWGLAMAFGGSGNFWHALAVVVYSTYPIMLISMLASLLILFLKSPEDISYLQSQGGLLKLNPNLLFEAPGVLRGILSRIDLLVIWGMFLGTVGLEKCFRISNSSAWIISIIIWLIGTGFAAMGGAFGA